MYIVCWYEPDGMKEIVGDFQSVLSVACLLEKDRTYFKVGMRGANLNQEPCGCGDFKYWLKHDVDFTRTRD